MKHLDLPSLEMFRHVAREGSVSRAAFKLNRVQSNVSTRIRQIEERVGSQLFERGRRGMVLTDKGHVLLEYADKILALADQAVDAVNDQRPEGIFRIGTMESTAAARLPTILSHYHAQFPDVSVHLKTETAGALIDLLRTNAIDVAFVAEPVEFDGLQSEPVFEEELMLIVPKTFMEEGLAQQMSGKTVIAFEEGCAYRRYLNQWMLEANIVPGAILSVGSYLGILACVSAGTGFAVVPQSVLERIGGVGSYKARPLGGSYAAIKTLLIWRDNYRSPKLDALFAVLGSDPIKTEQNERQCVVGNR